MSTRRIVVTHRRAHPVLGFLGVLVVLGAVIHFWYVVLGIVTVVAVMRLERRRRFAEGIAARVEQNRLRTRDYQRHKALTADDRAWLRSHGWTG